MIVTYTLTTYFYGEPPIADDYDNLQDATDAWEDTNWAASHAPKDVAGDIYRIVLKRGDTIIRSRSLPA